MLPFFALIFFALTKLEQEPFRLHYTADTRPTKQKIVKVIKTENKWQPKGFVDKSYKTNQKMSVNNIIESKSLP
mgnify:CR=1 FL=1